MILSCFAAIPIAIAAALYHNYAHNKFLKQNGCQVQFQAETGQRVSCGKGCTRAEIITVYECANGRRVEFN